MRWYLKRGKRGVVHSAVVEGGNNLVLMMTACGRSIRWDQPHSPWMRAKWNPSNGVFEAQVTCKQCRPSWHSTRSCPPTFIEEVN